MRSTKIVLILSVVLFALTTLLHFDAFADKVPVINTRGACLNVKEFVALIKDESKKMKTGQKLQLIADLPNEKEAREAIKTTGYPIVEEAKDKAKDSISFMLEVKK